MIDVLLRFFSVSGFPCVPSFLIHVLEVTHILWGDDLYEGFCNRRCCMCYINSYHTQDNCKLSWIVIQAMASKILPFCDDF
jgi:hypothetical protein